MNLDAGSLSQIANHQHKIEAKRAAANRVAQTSLTRHSFTLGALIAEVFAQLVQALHAHRNAKQDTTKLQLGGNR